MVFQPTIIAEVYIIWEMINLKDKRFDKTEAALKSAITVAAQNKEHKRNYSGGALPLGRGEQKYVLSSLQGYL